MEYWQKSAAAPSEARAQDAQDAQDVAAALLLRRVTAMLREGQPRQAIAHICDMTGVDHAQAEAFVESLKAGLFSPKR